MYSSQLLQLVGVAAAFSYVAWLVVTSRQVSRRRCELCGHLYVAHDPTVGVCRGRASTVPGVGPDDWTLCAYDLRCRCRGFITLADDIGVDPGEETSSSQRIDRPTRAAQGG
ncbi:hypothetical protein [Nocardia wallacei]|uniref:hypothetical protein n=1 Tax=Nocardia wallacei TaxID=480035 RepID=UPI00245562DC|nr:hypothetical protein [Nocardia wallacei]